MRKGGPGQTGAESRSHGRRAGVGGAQVPRAELREHKEKSHTGRHAEGHICMMPPGICRWLDVTTREKDCTPQTKGDSSDHGHSMTHIHVRSPPLTGVPEDGPST